MLVHLAAIAVAGMGAYTDLKYHKIYNKLTMRSLLAGLVYHLATGGMRGLSGSLLGIVAGSVFGFFWILGMLKAGDVKLYMAVGAVAGWRFCVGTMVFSVLIGGIVASFFMIARKTWKDSCKRLKAYLFHLLYTRRFSSYQPEEQSVYFSFGACIFAGTLAAAWYLGRQ